MKFPVAKFLKLPCLSLGFVLCAAAAANESFGWSLLPAVQVDATGIYLDQIVAGATPDVPHVRLAPAPSVGRPVVFSPVQLNDLLKQTASDLVTTNWTGAKQIRISRRMRALSESDLKEMLTMALQQDYVKDRGELELRFTRPVPTANIVDEVLTVKLLDLPTAGVTANFIARFELRANEEIAGTWQIPVQARIWREVYVAGSTLKRGTLLRDAEISRERRDVLAIRDTLTEVDLGNTALEVAENIPAGLPLTSRSLRLRPVVRRGKVTEAVVQDGGMTIAVKVEILEDGVPGQTIRVRNLKSKREFRGTVQNEETIHVIL
jgi:flagella basal body P-ring formation protein FlgA